VLAFSFHSAAMAGLVDHSCNGQVPHGGVHADQTTPDDDHSCPESLNPCCTNACTLLLAPFSPAFPAVPAAHRITIPAEPVRTGIQPDGLRRPPRLAAC
jgi:hypothetical protein